RQAEEHRHIDGIAAAAGTAMFLAGLTLAAGSGAVLVGGGLLVAGAAAGLPALRRLVPAGTLTARRGLPATILSRGLLTFAFFGADAYVTLSITVVRHRSPVVAGIAVTGATLAWTAGAWAQARLSERWAGRGLVRAGLVIILVGIAGMALMLQPGVPVAAGLAAWTVAGLGMGLAYAPISLMMLREAPPGREGSASAGAVRRWPRAPARAWLWASWPRSPSRRRWPSRRSRRPAGRRPARQSSKTARSRRSGSARRASVKAWSARYPTSPGTTQNKSCSGPTGR